MHVTAFNRDFSHAISKIFQKIKGSSALSQEERRGLSSLTPHFCSPANMFHTCYFVHCHVVAHQLSYNFVHVEMVTPPRPPRSTSLIIANHCQSVISLAFSAQDGKSWDACAYLRQGGKDFSEGTSMNMYAPSQE